MAIHLLALTSIGTTSTFAHVGAGLAPVARILPSMSRRWTKYTKPRLIFSEFIQCREEEGGIAAVDCGGRKGCALGRVRHRGERGLATGHVSGVAVPDQVEFEASRSGTACSAALLIENGVLLFSNLTGEWCLRGC